MKICCESKCLSTEFAFGIFNEKLLYTPRAGGEILLENVFQEFLIKLKAFESLEALF